jgi:hypothetical protein
VAVENPPESTPVMVMVSALTVTAVKRKRAKNENRAL